MVSHGIQLTFLFYSNTYCFILKFKISEFDVTPLLYNQSYYLDFDHDPSRISTNAFFISLDIYESAVEILRIDLDIFFIFLIIFNLSLMS